MPISPKQMSAFVNKGKMDPMPPSDDEAAAVAEPEPEVDDGTRFEALAPLLEEYAEEIEDCCDELDGDMLVDSEVEIGPDDAQTLKDGFESLDRRLRREAEKALAGVSSEQAEALAEALEERDLINDPERVAGWFFRIGAMLEGSKAPGDEAEVEEMPDDDEELEDEDL